LSEGDNRKKVSPLEKKREEKKRKKNYSTVV